MHYRGRRQSGRGGKKTNWVTRGRKAGLTGVVKIKYYLLGVLAGLVVLVYWYGIRGEVAEMAPPKLAVTQAYGSAPKPAFTQVAAPTAPVAQPPTPGSAPAAPAASGPRAELNATMDDIIGVLQTGDAVAAFERFLSPEFLGKLPPEGKAEFEQQILAQLATPRGQQGMQQMMDVLKIMKTQTPQLNATSDRATYPIDDPSGVHSFPPQISFQKVNGTWYVVPPGG